MGALATQVGDVLGCGEPDILLKVRKYLGRRFEGLQVQAQSFVHVGMGMSLANDFPGLSAQENFTTNQSILRWVSEMFAAP